MQGSHPDYAPSPPHMQSERECLALSEDIILLCVGLHSSALCVGSMSSVKLKLEDTSDFSTARFMESYESKHSDQSFTSKLAKELGVTAAPLRLDSQAKYGAAHLAHACSMHVPWSPVLWLCWVVKQRWFLSAHT